MAFLTIYAGGQNKVIQDPQTKLFNFDFTTKLDIIQLPNSEISYSIDLNVQQKDRSVSSPIISVNGLKGFPFTLVMSLKRDIGDTYHTAEPSHITVFKRLLTLIKNTSEDDTPLIVPLFWCPRQLDNGYFSVNELINRQIKTYSSTSTYQIGDEVVYSDVYYLCTTDVTTPESFDSNKWTSFTIDKPQPTIFYGSDINAINEVFYNKGYFNMQLEYVENNLIKIESFSPYCVPIVITNLPTKEDVKTKSRIELKGIFVTDIE